MRKFIYLLICIILNSKTYSQVPGNLSFQAVIRNASNVLVVSSPVGVKISLLQGSSTGSAVYVETHTPTTNPNGLITLEIGGGKAVSGDFKNINWGLGNYFIKVETDPAGGTNYSISSTTQVLSVPYALYAKKSADVDSLSQKLKALDSAYNNSNFGGKNTIIISDEITEAEAQAKLLKDWGPNTETIIINRCSNIEKIDLSRFTALLNLIISDNEKLKEVNLSNLLSVGASFTINNCPKLLNLNLDKLEKITELPDSDGFSINRTGLKELNLKSLSNIVGGIYMEGNDSLLAINFPNLIGSKNTSLFFYRNSKLKTISLPNLKMSSIDIYSTSIDSLILPKYKGYDGQQIGINSNNQLASISLPEYDSAYNQYISIHGNRILKNISLPKLISISQISIGDNDSLRLLSFPSLSLIGGKEFSAVEVVENDNLNEFKFDALSKFEGSTMRLDNNKLSSTVINSLLSKFVSIFPQTSATVSQKQIQLGQKVAAKPTGQGLIDKQTLINRGHSVSTN